LNLVWNGEYASQETQKAVYDRLAWFISVKFAMDFCTIFELKGGDEISRRAQFASPVLTVLVV
jgi:hypothetical protein